MAVYTHVTEAEVSALLESYEIGDLVELTGIKQGVSNTNYIVKTTQDRFILTIFEDRTPSADLPFFAELMRHLAGSQIPSPSPLARKDGGLLSDIKGRRAILVSFLNGRMPSFINPAVCSDVGLWLARVHVAGQSANLTRPNSMDLTAWVDLYEKTRARADEVKEGLGSILDDEIVYLKQHWPRDLPRGVIHADMFPDNVFFDGEHLCGLIDFYFACTDLLAYDLAITFNAWCFEPNNVAFNITKARALLRGYERVRPLTAEEKWRLPTLMRGASVRFLMTRLYDWLNQPPGALVKPHNPLDYLKRLTFHQQITSLTAYGFDP